MTFKKRILTGIGALAFLAVLVLNVQLVNTSSVQEEGFASLSLVELEVQAQSEGEDDEGGSCGEKPLSFDCDSGGAGALSCEISETLVPIYSKGCKVTCEGNGCYACCDDYLDKCICVTFGV